MDTRRNRIIAIAFILLGLFLLTGEWVGFLTIVALLFLILGIYRIRGGHVSTGYKLLGIGAVLILLDHLILIVAVCLISLGLFYSKSKAVHQRAEVQPRLHFLSSLDLDQIQWVMRDMSDWQVIGEADLDLTLAIPEEKYTVILLQGMVGDVDLRIPDDYGTEIEALVLFGSIEFDGKRDQGMLNRLNWRSPNYDHSEYKVKFVINYVVGDLDINLS